MTTTTGLYADKLPPRAPTLTDLANRLIASHNAARDVVRSGLDDTSDITAWDAEYDAREAFLAAFEDRTGITRHTLALLGGIL